MTNLFRKWQKHNRGNVALEAAIIFPFLVMLMMGVVDVGNGLVVNQKAIRSAQMIGDLIARGVNVTPGGLTDITDVGATALFPAPVSVGNGNFDVDIISIQFVDTNNDGVAEAQTCWRRQSGAYTNNVPLNSAVDTLNGQVGDGIVAVSIRYNYTPSLGGFLVHDVAMEEVVFVRGRQTPVIQVAGVGCPGGNI